MSGRRLQTQQLSVLISAVSLILTGLGPAHADSTSEAQAARKQCTEAQKDTPRRLEQCARADFYDSDAEMNALYTEKMAALQDDSRPRLKDAQRAWLSYRDKSCVFESGSRDAGNWNMQNYTCMTTHTRQRIKELKDYLSQNQS